MKVQFPYLIVFMSNSQTRFLLDTSWQHDENNQLNPLDEFLRKLHKLGKDCNFKVVTAQKYREELVCDASINGIASPLIRQQLLESWFPTFPGLRHTWQAFQKSPVPLLENINSKLSQ